MYQFSKLDLYYIDIYQLHCNLDLSSLCLEFLILPIKFVFASSLDTNYFKNFLRYAVPTENVGADGR